MTSTSPSVPPGQYPPFAAITDTDHRAWIIIAAAFGLCMTLLASAMRAFIRLSVSPGWGVDDSTFAASNVIAWIQSSIVLAACSKGLGQSLHLIPLGAQENIEVLYYTSNLLFVLSLGLSKASVGLFLLRLTPMKRQRQSLIALLGFLALWVVAAFFGTAFQCGASRPWIVVGRKCGSGWMTTLGALEGLACVYEIAIVVAATWIIWRVQMAFDNKMIIVLAFSFRLLLIIATGFRIGSFNKNGLATNPTLLEAAYICWTQAEMNYSIVSATIPSATKLVKSLSTNYGVAYGVTGDAYGTSLHTSGNRYADHTATEGIPMNSLKSLKNRTSGTATGGHPFQALNSKEDINYSYEIGSVQRAPKRTNSTVHREREPAKMHPTDSASFRSDHSEQMIIRKDVTYEVQRDSPDVI